MTFRKMVTMNLCETIKDTDAKNRLLDSLGEGKGWMF